MSDVSTRASSQDIIDLSERVGAHNYHPLPVVIAEAEARGQQMVDSPMSGGVGGATAGTLTFMVGGSDAAFTAAKPALEAMGKNIFHAGRPGAGSAAKICNNMMLAIQMISVAEGFSLAERLGLDAQKLYDISSTATARCWSLNDYCPAPGPVPAAPSNRDYQPGFAAALMLKDLRIAMEAAQGVRKGAAMLGFQDHVWCPNHGSHRR